MEVFIIVIYTVGDHVIMFIFLAHIVFKNLSGGGNGSTLQTLIDD